MERSSGHSFCLCRLLIKIKFLITKLILRSNVVLFSFAALSTAGFVGISPKGRGMDAARRSEGRTPSLPTPDKTEERRKQRQSSRLFFGYFLGGIPTQSFTAIKLSEKVKAWSVELQLLCFKTAKAVLLQIYRFLNLMAVTQSMGTRKVSRPRVRIPDSKIVAIPTSFTIGGCTSVYPPH